MAMWKDATPAQILLAWLLAQESCIPIPGTVKLHHVDENLGTTDFLFTNDELEEFRNSFEKIKLIGVHEPESVLKDQ